MNFTPEIWILWFLNTTLQTGLILKLFSTGLRLSFPHFRLYLAVSLLITLLQLSLRLHFPMETDLYAWIFVIWSYLSSFFEFLLIRELNTSALAPFPAIKSASTRTLNAFWGILIAVGAAWYVYLSSSPIVKYPILVTALRYHDAVALGFTLYILLFLAFVAWMPVPLSKNVLNHTFLIAAYFLSITLSRFVVQFGSLEAQSNVANYISLGGASIVFLLWIIKIRAGQDDTLNTPKGPLNREEALEMLARLEELNRTLSRSGPKVLR